VRIEAAGSQLAALKDFHGARAGADGTADVGHLSRTNLIRAMRLHAPGFAQALGFTMQFLESAPAGDRLTAAKDKPLGETEAVFWNEIGRRLKAQPENEAAA
jgi:hypothetical protein